MIQLYLGYGDFQVRSPINSPLTGSQIGILVELALDLFFRIFEMSHTYKGK
jgi:hypothetical protein